MQPTSTLFARWGLLITALATEIAMVTMGILAFMDARDSARAVIRSRGSDVIFAVRRVFMIAGQPNQESLEKVAIILEPQGVQFIGLVDNQGKLKLEVGEPSCSLNGLPKNPPRLSPELLRTGEGNIIRAVSFLVPIQTNRYRAKANEHADMDYRLVVDFEPEVANGIERRALVSLIFNLSAAAVLLVIAVLFWRLSRRADRIATQLEKDRRLAILGEMSAVLGHELRNPLTALKGHAQLLLEKLSPDHLGWRGAETVVREATRLEKLNCQMLDFVRTGELQLLDTNPEEVIRSAIAQLDSNRIRTTIDALPSWPLDRGRLQRVLVNLIENALQASPPDADVELSAKIEDDQLVIIVKDNGDGLPQGEEDRVFEPFFTGRTRGTGLGLAVAKRIVEGHGGRIDARNCLDGGAVFTASLPRRRST